NVPRSLAGMFWGYRVDKAPVKVERIEQLFDSKLKGQICWPGPSINSNLQLLSLALSAGGNEQNMEPGSELLKKLAKSGNIGHHDTESQVQRLRGKHRVQRRRARKVRLFPEFRGAVGPAQRHGQTLRDGDRSSTLKHERG